MCGGNKNTTTQQSTSTTAPPGYIQNALQGILGQAQGVSQTPYNPATQQQIAGLTPQQQQAFQNVSNTQGIANPYIQQATNLANQSGAPISADQISNYSNPYQQQVINSTMAEMNQNNAQQQQQVTGNAAIQGALGGDRTAVAQSALAGQQALANNATLAGLNSQNYSQALGAAQADRNAAGQASYQMGNLGNEAQQTAYTDINQLAQAGNAQQQQQQNVYNAGTANAQAQSQYPFQTSQWLAGILGGLGGLAGGTTNSNGTTTTPNANPFSQALGLGLGLTKFFADGGSVEGGLGTPRRYDDGGSVGLGDGLNFDTSSMAGTHMFSDKQSDALAKLGAQIAAPTPQKSVQMLQANPYHASGGGGGMSAPVPYSRPGFADGGDIADVGFDPALGYWPSDSAPVAPATAPAPEALAKDVAAPSPGLSGISGLTASAANPGLAASPAPSPAPTPAVNAPAPVANTPTPEAASAPTPDNSNLPRGLRNNNPGNIEYGPFAKAQGATGSDGRFAIFPNAEAGQAAMGKLLQNYQNNHNLNTVQGIVGRWAPPGENNVTNYADFVAKSMGVGPNDPIDVNDPTTNAKLRQGITAYENGTKTGLSGSTASAMNPSLAPSQAAAQPDKSVSHSGLFGNPFGLSDNARDALSTAGFAMMASKSPNFGNAVGEGGLAGLNAYQQNKLLDQKAKQLSEQSEMHKAQLAQMTASTENAKQKLALEMSKPVLMGQTVDALGNSKAVYGLPDPKTGKLVPVDPASLQPQSGQPSQAPQTPIPDDVHGEDLIKAAGLNANQATLIKGMASYGMPIEQFRRLQNNPQLMSMVERYDPNFDAKEYKARQSLIDSFKSKSDANEIKSYNTLMGHVSNLYNHVDALNNSDSSWWNGVKNTFKDQYDPQFQRAVGKINTDIDTAVAEYNKATTGKPITVEESKHWHQMVSRDASPQTMKAVADEMLSNVQSRMEATAQKWNRGMNLNPGDPGYKTGEGLLDPHPRELYNTIRAQSPDQNAPAGAGTAAAPQNPTVPNPFQPGTAAAAAKQAPDGNWYLPDPQRPGKYLKVNQ